MKALFISFLLIVGVNLAAEVTAQVDYNKGGRGSGDLKLATPGLKAYLSIPYPIIGFPLAGIETVNFSLGLVNPRGSTKIWDSWDTLKPGSSFWEERAGWFLSDPLRTWSRGGIALRLWDNSLGGWLVRYGGSDRCGLSFSLGNPWKIDGSWEAFQPLISQGEASYWKPPPETAGVGGQGVLGLKGLFHPWGVDVFLLGKFRKYLTPVEGFLGALRYTQKGFLFRVMGGGLVGYSPLDGGRTGMVGVLLDFTSGVHHLKGEGVWDQVSGDPKGSFLNNSPGLDRWNLSGSWTRKEDMVELVVSLNLGGIPEALSSYRLKGEVNVGPEFFHALISGMVKATSSEVGVWEDEELEDGEAKLGIESNHQDFKGRILIITPLQVLKSGSIQFQGEWGPKPVLFRWTVQEALYPQRKLEEFSFLGRIVF